MKTEATRSTPSWALLFVASVVIGPAMLAGAVGVMHVAQTEPWKGPPEIRPITADPPLQTSGVIAFVERPPRAGEDPTRGCVFVVRASGETPARRLGCSGDGIVPPTIARISWTASGDLRVLAGTGQAIVLPVDAGKPAKGSIPELKRTAGRRTDGTRVYSAVVAEDSTNLAVRQPLAGRRTIVSFDGPPGYFFGRPQWSPDGEWILVSDTEGRLLIVDEHGHDIRQLLPPKRSRNWLEEPYLTWHQGRRS